jgi:hypothetical protein
MEGVIQQTIINLINLVGNSNLRIGLARLLDILEVGSVSLEE